MGLIQYFEELNQIRNQIRNDSRLYAEKAIENQYEDIIDEIPYSELENEISRLTQKNMKIFRDVRKYSSEELIEFIEEDGSNLKFVLSQTPEICLKAVKQNGRALEYVENQTPEICLEAVKQDGRALEFVENQTPEMCMTAVKQNVWALEFVENQTPEMCMTAVKQDERALYYVKNQTPEICLEAVKQNGWALQFVKNKTPEMCMTAVKQKGWALEFVENQTPEICLEAVKQKGTALRFVKNRTPEICLEAVKQDGTALEYVRNQTPEVCLEAVKQNGEVLQFVENQTPQMCMTAVKQNGWALHGVKKQTPEICLEAVKQNGEALQFVKNQTPEICLEALKQNKMATEFIKKELKQDVLNKYEQYLKDKEKNMSDLLNEKETSSVAGSLESLKNQNYKDTFVEVPALAEDSGQTKKAVIPSSERVPVERLNTKKLEQLLSQDNLPFLPNEKGFCDVKAVKMTVKGFELTGANQLIAKSYLHERGMTNDNIITFNQAKDLGSPVKAGEKAFHLTYYDKNSGKNTVVRYFAESQTANPALLPYQKTITPSNEKPFVQDSADVLNYLTNYLSCVHENRPFKVSQEAANEFKQKFADELKKSPLQIYKIGNIAEKQIYARTEQGKQWLKSENGQKWLKTEPGKDFLKTDIGKAFIAEKPQTVPRSQVMGFER